MNNNLPRQNSWRVIELLSYDYNTIVNTVHLMSTNDKLDLLQDIRKVFVNSVSKSDRNKKLGNIYHELINSLFSDPENQLLKALVEYKFPWTKIEEIILDIDKLLIKVNPKQKEQESKIVYLNYIQLETLRSMNRKIEMRGFGTETTSIIDATIEKIFNSKIIF